MALVSTKKVVQSSYLASTVGINTVVSIDGKHFVGVDSDAEETRVGVDEELGVTGLKFF